MSTLVIDNQPPSLKGGMLWIGALVLAMANFLAVLNMTIANVTQPNMAVPWAQEPAGHVDHHGLCRG